jgi:hypothetical protein
MVYGTEAILPPEIYLESARVTHFNAEDHAEIRELDTNLLEERRNTALSIVHKYQASLKSTTTKLWYRESLISGT